VVPNVPLDGVDGIKGSGAPRVAYVTSEMIRGTTCTSGAKRISHSTY